MKHVDAWLQDSTLRNLIHAAVGRRRETVGSVESQLSKCSRVKQRAALAIRIDLHHRAQQRPVPRVLGNVEIAIGIALGVVQESATHLRSHAHGGGGAQRDSRSCNSWSGNRNLGGRIGRSRIALRNRQGGKESSEGEKHKRRNEEQTRLASESPANPRSRLRTGN